MPVGGPLCRNVSAPIMTEHRPVHCTLLEDVPPLGNVLLVTVLEETGHELGRFE